MQVNFKTNSFTHGNSIESQNGAFNGLTELKRLIHIEMLSQRQRQWYIKSIGFS